MVLATYLWVATQPAPARLNTNAPAIMRLVFIFIFPFREMPFELDLSGRSPVWSIPGLVTPRKGRWVEPARRPMPAGATTGSCVEFVAPKGFGRNFLIETGKYLPVSDVSA